MNWPIVAHPGEPLTLHNLWFAWTLDPALLILFVLAVFFYALGLWHLWRHAGVGHGISKRRSLAFTGAVLSVLVALVSPLDGLSETLFSAHMVQHLVLILISAPLLVMNDFPVAFLWALPCTSAHQVGRGLAQSRPLIRTGGW